LKEKTLFRSNFVRLEVFTVVTVKNAIFCDVMPCGSCKKEGTYCLYHQGGNNQQARNNMKNDYQCHSLQEPHYITSQKMALFTVILKSQIAHVNAYDSAAGVRNDNHINCMKCLALTTPYR
jgi:hypothetical protein